ncbi:MAG TPA: quinoprotein dehydrogenase-associated putative ABC transporter substrate-binding protein [Bryobacteraceae bacterium]|jgi:quinoprotein dehydrogenase-associated probable ABC transporter substrate-binding protein
MFSLSHSVALTLISTGLCCTAADLRTFRVCADPNNLPFSNEAGQGLENKLAQIVAHDLSVNLQYVWFAERRGFLRHSLDVGLCDAVLGVPIDVEGALVTRPYYRSTYVTVTKPELKIASLYDSRLRNLRIGLHMIGDDYVPPGHLLAAEGLAGQIVGYSLYGAYGQADPPARLIDAVANGQVDVAIVWGPFGGYFAKKASIPLAVEPVSPTRFRMVPFTYSIGVAVRKGDVALQSAIQQVLDKECPAVRALLKEYAFPSPEEEEATPCGTSSLAVISSH